MNRSCLVIVGSCLSWLVVAHSPAQCLPIDGSAACLDLPSGKEPLVPVTCFGAMPNDTVSDSAEIQCAVNWMHANTSGGTLVFPPGTYEITASIDLPVALNARWDGEAKLTLYGPGARLVVHPTVTAIRRITTACTQLLDNVAYLWRLDGLSFVGPGSAYAPYDPLMPEVHPHPMVDPLHPQGLTRGAELHAIHTLEVVNCSFTSLDVGLDLRFCLNAQIHDNIFAVNGRYGLVLGAPPIQEETESCPQGTTVKNSYGCNGAHFSGNEMYGACVLACPPPVTCPCDEAKVSHALVYVRSADSLSVHDSIFEGEFRFGILIGAGREQNTTITNSWFEGNPKHAFIRHQDVGQLVVDRPQVTSTSGLFVDASDAGWADQYSTLSVMIRDAPSLGACSSPPGTPGCTNRPLFATRHGDSWLYYHWWTFDRVGEGLDFHDSTFWKGGFKPITLLHSTLMVSERQIRTTRAFSPHDNSTAWAFTSGPMLSFGGSHIKFIDAVREQAPYYEPIGPALANYAAYFSTAAGWRFARNLEFGGNPAGTTTPLNLDFNQSTLREVVIDPLSSAPIVPVAGRLWFDTPSGTLRFFDGSNTMVVQALPCGPPCP